MDSSSARTFVFFLITSTLCGHIRPQSQPQNFKKIIIDINNGIITINDHLVVSNSEYT